ncbi:hypothetical protein [Aquimarina sp. AU58]|uniref:hypothetical protein n=1 Tax=Aquimarina sp. AU58 TaxID=1874112 RepID=UPI000D652F2F|nr:hypothetical protein [Aquimarina sp. AU58]
MYSFTIHVSIRKGLGPEWFQKVFTVDYKDIDPDITIEELKEWAKEDVRSQLKSSNCYGENWIIQDVESTKA